MKSRAKELLERSLAAIVAALEIFNKPNFKYREDTFAILVINAWELLLKSKWISDNGNKLSSLYVIENVKNKDGAVGKKKRVKKTRSGNPFTHSLDYLGKKLVATKQLSQIALDNINVLLEIRDSAIHFYNTENIFSIRLQEIGAAAIHNYTTTAQQWFCADFSKYNLYILPLGFIQPKQHTGIILNREEKRFLNFLDSIEKKEHSDERYSISISIDVSFSKSKADDALKMRKGDSPIVVDIRLTEEQLKDKYPMSYKDLTNACRIRYVNFKQTPDFYDILKELKMDTTYSYERELHPGNPKSAKTNFYSTAIWNRLDRHYTKK